MAVPASAAQFTYLPPSELENASVNTTGLLQGIGAQRLCIRHYEGWNLMPTYLSLNLHDYRWRAFIFEHVSNVSSRTISTSPRLQYYYCGWLRRVPELAEDASLERQAGVHTPHVSPDR